MALALSLSEALSLARKGKRVRPMGTGSDGAWLVWVPKSFIPFESLPSTMRHLTVGNGVHFDGYFATIDLKSNTLIPGWVPSLSDVNSRWYVWEPRPKLEFILDDKGVLTDVIDHGVDPTNIGPVIPPVVPMGVDFNSSEPGHFCRLGKPDAIRSDATMRSELESVLT